jgi:RNA polymerase subunit RPABC4/transcription elongation factor Spt4
MKTCINCAALLNEDSSFCYTCGSIVTTGNELSVECEMHPDRFAAGFCVICGKPVCIDCEIKSDGKVLCTNPEHRTILQDWQMLIQLDSEFEAEALEHNLTDSGIEARIFSLHDHIATRWLIENRVLIFVRKLELEKAMMLLQELSLIENLIL